MALFGINTSSKPDYLVVGLGNPGDKYARTRHNVGFCAVKYIADSLGVRLDRLKHFALVARCVISDKSVLLMQPQTYMNDSGRAVKDAASFYGIPAERIIVIFDDVSLPVGRHRFRKSGSAGGHNGIKSIILHLGTQDFPRLKIGVGEKPYPDMDLADHVLGKFPDEDFAVISADFDIMLDAVKYIIADEYDKAANTYNK